MWHLEPSLSDPDTVYAGVEDAALFRTTDGGAIWHELSGLRKHGSGPHWQPGAGGLCLHTILLDPSKPQRIVHRDLGGRRVPHRRRRHDVEADQQGPDVRRHPGPRRRGRPLRPSHRHASRRGRTCCSCRSTGTSCAATTPATSVDEGERQSADRLRLRHRRARARARDDLRGADQERLASTSRSTASCASIAAARGGNEWEPLTKGLPQKDCYVNVLRDAMAVDSLDSCGIYFGTTGGQVYCVAGRRRLVERDRPRPAAGALGRGPDAAVAPMPEISVVLPQHLQTLARVRAAKCRSRWRAS